MTEELNTQGTDSTPTGGGLPPEQAEITPAETATPEPTPEDIAIAELETAAPEERPGKREGLQKRISEITSKRREAEQQARTLELENARLQGRIEALGTAGQQVQPAQVQEPVIPAPQMPARPDASLWTDNEGYEDQDKKIEVLAKWQSECQIAQWRHEQNVERITADNTRRAQEGQALVNDIIQAYPDFATKMNVHKPSPAVGEAIGILATIDRKAAINTANYLVNNPAALQQLNSLHPEAARVALGQLAQRLTLPPPSQKKVSDAPPPANQVVSTETHETFDPVKSDMDTYARHHPACAPWLK